MRRHSLLVGALIAMVCTLVPSAALAQPAQVDVVVKLEDAPVAAAAAGTGGEVVKQIDEDTAVLRVPGSDAAGVAASLQRRDGVEWAEPEVIYSATRTPNDTCYVSTCAGQTQWGPRKVNAPAAWDVRTGAPQVRVAVIDSGVDATHPDLDGVVEVGPNYSTDASSDDEFGHGTHVAGVVGAETNNSTGMAGIVWDAEIVSVKVLDSFGDGNGSSVAQALIWAADNDVDVANLSFAGTGARVVAEAVEYAQSKGVLLVAAAGNGPNGQAGTSSVVYPAAYPGVLAVGASNPDDTRGAYSNFGTWVDVLAPGTDIVSTWPSGVAPFTQYRTLSGTSMSTPVVAGAAALVWAERPYSTAASVADRLRSTAAQVAGSGTVVATGRVDLGAALGSNGNGYRMAASDGGVFNFGEASFDGSAGSVRLNQPVVSMASAGKSTGYWLVASDGGVFSYGDAAFLGSTGGWRLNRPIVGASATRGGNGYWLVASDGGVFSFGDARFYGSTGAMRLAQPIAAMVPTETGRGYWLVASDGGVFSFGDAQFYGSTGGQRINAPIVGAARTASGNGYWLVASDGGVFSFGDAQFRGSAGGTRLNQPIVAIVAAERGDGYMLIASDGGVFAYGNAVFRGSTGGQRLNSPIVSAVAQP